MDAPGGALVFLYTAADHLLYHVRTMGSAPDRHDLDGSLFPKHGGFCLKTQWFPDSHRHRTVHKFST